MNRQLGLLWGGVALALVLLSPFALRFAADGLPWKCHFKGLTGIPCPTCGTTRAALSLAELEPLHALIHYPLPTVVWILFIGGGLVAGFRAWRRLPLPDFPNHLPVWARIAIVGALLANWAYSIATDV